MEAINENGKPSLVNIDQSVANKVGLNQLNRERKKRFKIRQLQSLNKIAEQRLSTHQEVGATDARLQKLTRSPSDVSRD
ncbi:hypothetical protein [Nitrospira sp. Ecomares 2.1]